MAQDPPGLSFGQPRLGIPEVRTLSDRLPLTVMEGRVQNIFVLHGLAFMGVYNDTEDFVS